MPEEEVVSWSRDLPELVATEDRKEQEDEEPGIAETTVRTSVTTGPSGAEDHRGEPKTAGPGEPTLETPRFRRSVATPVLKKISIGPYFVVWAPEIQRSSDGPTLRSDPSDPWGTADIGILDPDVLRAGTNQQKLPGNDRQHQQLRAFPRIKKVGDGNDGATAVDGESGKVEPDSEEQLKEEDECRGGDGGDRIDWSRPGRGSTQRDTKVLTRPPSPRSRQGARRQCAHTLATLWGERGIFSASGDPT
ncbi:hypothetical protein NDU88_002402 [Pleurodeles waltl]|uniref:Uncharacterized protein n=1 Tax=Pleurodeles waltl TaxID=8319 RepID=A0AAV7SBI0_PLEWA|nr:hypothetical protein NDU88_002402 [Pleurodeles waltl]